VPSSWRWARFAIRTASEWDSGGRIARYSIANPVSTKHKVGYKTVSRVAQSL
jgi:hypothetical protein